MAKKNGSREILSCSSWVGSSVFKLPTFHFNTKATAKILTLLLVMKSEELLWFWVEKLWKQVKPLSIYPRVQEHLVSDRNSHIFKYTHNSRCTLCSAYILLLLLFVLFNQHFLNIYFTFFLYFVQTWTEDDRRTVETFFQKVLFIFLNLLHIFSLPDLTKGNDHQWRNLLIGKQILLVSTWGNV